MIKILKRRNKKNVEPAENLPPETQLEKIAARIEKMRLADYLNMANRPTRIIWTNFLAGAARGIGFTVGAALIITVVVRILTCLISIEGIPESFKSHLIGVVEIIKAVPTPNSNTSVAEDAAARAAGTAPAPAQTTSTPAPAINTTISGNNAAALK